MSTPQNSILDVDLHRFERGSREQAAAVVDGVMRSLSTGFVYLRHDVPEDLIDGAYALLSEFFHLPQDVKDTSVAPGSMGQTGYTGLLVETAASRDVPDWKEMLNWGLELPDGHPLRTRYPHRYMGRVLPDADVPGIGAALALLWDRFQDVQRRFLRIVATGLGADAGYFEGMLRGGPTLCRAIRYPPMPEAPGQAHIWAGEHEDINLTTALPRATAPGLQVLIDEEWVDAVAPAGYAILNSGMMLDRVTNGRISAGPHRVVAPPGATEERFSVVQFCHPSPWTVLAPMRSCVTLDSPEKYSAIEAGAWLDDVLYDINLVEDARRVG